MRFRISKWVIFKDSLFLLFYPFMVFDIFLFYDEGIEALRTSLAIWSVIFSVALVFYLYERRASGRSIVPMQLAEVAFFSFEILFFVGNFFLGGLFTFLLYTGNRFII
jgi:hypothetical protein